MSKRPASTARTSPSFPRSAWECPLGRSAAPLPPRKTSDAERRGRHSHAERGNEGKFVPFYPCSIRGSIPSFLIDTSVAHDLGVAATSESDVVTLVPSG